MSGVELLGLLLFGVEDGLVVLLGLVEFMSVLLELELGDVELLEPDGEEVDGDAEFMSVLRLELEGDVLLPLAEEGEVVEDGEVDVLVPVWLDDEDGVL